MTDPKFGEIWSNTSRDIDPSFVDVPTVVGTSTFAETNQKTPKTRKNSDSYGFEPFHKCSLDNFTKLNGVAVPL